MFVHNQIQWNDFNSFNIKNQNNMMDAHSFWKFTSYRDFPLLARTRIISGASQFDFLNFFCFAKKISQIKLLRNNSKFIREIYFEQKYQTLSFETPINYPRMYMQISDEKAPKKQLANAHILNK